MGDGGVACATLPEPLKSLIIPPMPYRPMNKNRTELKPYMNKGEPMQERHSRKTELEEGEVQNGDFAGSHNGDLWERRGPVSKKWRRSEVVSKKPEFSKSRKLFEGERGELALEKRRKFDLDRHKDHHWRSPPEEYRKRPSFKSEISFSERDSKKNCIRNNSEEFEPGEIKPDNRGWPKWSPAESDSRKILDRPYNKNTPHPSSSASSFLRNSSNSNRYHSSRNNHDRHGPHDQPHYRDYRDRTPVHPEWSPLHRPRQINHRDQTPSHPDRSPHNHRSRRHDYRERTPVHPDRSPRDRDSTKKSRASEKQESYKSNNTNSVRQSGKSNGMNRNSEEKTNTEKSTHSTMKSRSREPTPPVPPPPPPSSPPVLPPPPPLPTLSQTNGGSLLEETISTQEDMEEDMDISETPPHESVSVVSELGQGKWLYLDHFGIEQGLARLSDLKKLMEDGFIHSDHLIKHSETDRWVTVENARSPPLVQSSFQSVVLESESKVSSLAESRRPLLDLDLNKGELDLDLDLNLVPFDFRIDERVETLLDGYTLKEGKELEILGEALDSKFQRSADLEKWVHFEGTTRSHIQNNELPRNPSDTSTETHNSVPVPPPVHSSYSNWFSVQWSCKGGDWKRSEDATTGYRRKLVLNEGYPLCQMPPNRTQADPRGAHMDDLYYPSRTKRLELPSWAFSSIEENSNNTDAQARPIRGVKGTVLPVVRINACVVKEKSNPNSNSNPNLNLNSSFDPRVKSRGVSVAPADCHVSWSSRSSRSHSIGSDQGGPGPAHESGSGPAHSLSGRRHRHHHHHHNEPPHDFQSLSRCRTVLAVPTERVRTADELSVDLGGWFYLDGTGQERGPHSYRDMQDFVKRGVIMAGTSVFRKIDNTWVPAVRDLEVSRRRHSSSSSSSLGSFHEMHPQFIGYARGKLHELVMRSYKNRELAAAINEVLDPWITSKQPKKESETHFPFNSTVTTSEDGVYRSAKRTRLFHEESDGDPDTGDKRNDCSFEELCGGPSFAEGGSKCESWGLLDRIILARVFHFLRTDVRSLHSSATTCLCWNEAAKFYKNMSRLVDLSSLGPKCTDSIFQAVLADYDKDKVRTLVLSGCFNISVGALDETLQSYSQVSYIDIRGCLQFRDLKARFQHVRWVGPSYFDEPPYLKTRSLKQINDRTDTNPAFRPGFYKRSKMLLDSRKSSDVLSRDAQMRRWLQRKSEYEYRKTKEFVINRLREIMKGNRFDFFVPKVAKIEDRLRNGYYARHGLRYLKDDIIRMCSDAMKFKRRGDAGEMKQTIVSFIQLARRLEDPKPAGGKDENTTSLKDNNNNSSNTNSSESNKSKNKKPAKPANEKKGRTDREIKRSLSKLKKRDIDSDSETESSGSFSEVAADVGESESSRSETDSDLDFNSAGGTSSDLTSLKLDDSSIDSMSDDREWGARMTKASLVPPITRKYEVIDKYLIVADEQEVKRKMRVALPEDYSEKLQSQKNGGTEELLELPEVKEYKPRKTLGVEVIEQEVYGIDPYTHNLLLDSMPDEPGWSLGDKQLFIEELLTKTLNNQVRHFTGSGNTPMVYPLRPCFEEIHRDAEGRGDSRTVKMCHCILRAMRNRPDDNYVAYRKGLGVVCNKEEGFGADDFVVEFLGEVYPAWRWYEKQDGIRMLQKNSQEPAPEFYNIYLERPKGDRDGYDLVVVDAMHKANYASRICHSCRPNCEAKVTAVDGQYQIGIYALRPISFGEEITFDYNSVTESKEEYEASVCLCGSQICRGSYLSLAGEEAFQKAMQECHGVLDRHKLMLEACEADYVTEQDCIDLAKAGLGPCLLSSLPDWLVAYSAQLVRFINYERTKLPDEILRRNLEEKRKYFSDISIENEKVESEIQADGVYNTRLQNVALTLDKVRYVMRSVYGDARRAPPPLVMLNGEEMVSTIWKGEGSLIDELLHSMAPHMDPDLFSELKSKIRARDPSTSDNPHHELRRSLLWLRDELRDLPCTYKCRHDAAADLIHMYAYTKCFFRVRGYKSVKSEPVYISPLDLGPKYADKMGSSFQEYCKTYGENYCLGQLIYWYSQTNAEPDSRLARAGKGCLSLPDISSFYAKSQKPVRDRVYGSRTVRFMLSRMERQPQRPWPKDRIWAFKNNPNFFGSPMLDAVLHKCPLDKEMVHWLKTRPNVFLG